MDSSDIRLTLDEDSDRDEAEASEDDMEDESEEGEITAVTTRKEGEDTAVKEEGGGEESQGGGSVRQPCILIFDSLAGSSKARTCQTLR